MAVLDAQLVEYGVIGVEDLELVFLELIPVLDRVHVAGINALVPKGNVNGVGLFSIGDMAVLTPDICQAVVDRLCCLLDE